MFASFSSTSTLGLPTPPTLRSPRRVLLVRARSGVGLDIALGGLPFEESVVARSSLFAFPSQTLLRTCSAEDLVVLKAFAARAKDWLDVEGVIIRQTGKLDWSYIRANFNLWPNSKKLRKSWRNLNGVGVEFEQ